MLGDTAKHVLVLANSCNPTRYEAAYETYESDVGLGIMHDYSHTRQTQFNKAIFIAAS